MIDYSDIEAPIREHVRAFNNAGWKTSQSCGHDMWVMVECSPGNELHLISWVLEHFKTRNITTTRDYGWADGKYLKVHFPKPENHGDGPHQYILLRVVKTDDPLYFVLRTPKYSDTWTADNAEYLYNEQTCPTNWTGDIVAVIEGADQDPHGFAQFVAMVDETQEVRDADPNIDWTEVFPQLTKSSG